MGGRCHAIFLVRIITSFENWVEINFLFKTLSSCLYILEVDLMSEVTFRYQVLWCFINLYETRFTKLSEGDKSSPRTTILTNPDLPRARAKVFKDSGGCVSKVFGPDSLEPESPTMIHDNKSRSVHIMQIKTNWFKQLGLGIWQKDKVGFSIFCSKKGHHGWDTFYQDLFVQQVPLFKS